MSPGERQAIGLGIRGRAASLSSEPLFFLCLVFRSPIGSEQRYNFLFYFYSYATKKINESVKLFKFT